MGWALAVAILFLGWAVLHGTVRERIRSIREEADANGWVVPEPDSLVWKSEHERQEMIREAEWANHLNAIEVERNNHSISVSYGEIECRAHCQALGCRWDAVEAVHPRNTQEGVEAARARLEERHVHHLAEIEQHRKQEQ